MNQIEDFSNPIYQQVKPFVDEYNLYIMSIGFLICLSVFLIKFVGLFAYLLPNIPCCNHMFDKYYKNKTTFQIFGTESLFLAATFMVLELFPEAIIAQRIVLYHAIYKVLLTAFDFFNHQAAVKTFLLKRNILIIILNILDTFCYYSAFSTYNSLNHEVDREMKLSLIVMSSFNLVGYLHKCGVFRADMKPDSAKKVKTN